MDLSVILRVISSALMVAQTYSSLSVSVQILFFSNVFFLPSLTLVFLPVILMFPLFLYSIPLCLGCTMSPMIGPNPQRAASYMNAFTISSPSAAESLAVHQHQRNATSRRSWILIYPSRSCHLHVHVWLVPGDCIMCIVWCWVGTAWTGSSSL